MRLKSLIDIPNRDDELHKTFSHGSSPRGGGMGGEFHGKIKITLDAQKEISSRNWHQALNYSGNILILCSLSRALIAYE